MADVTIQIRLNGGSVQTGAVTAAVGDTIQLTAANKTGWNVSTVRWEIYDYPPDFTVPAGWSTDADGVFYVLGSADPPSFVCDEWGKYLTRVIAANQTDERTIVDIASPSGLKDMMRREGAQVGGNRLQWVHDQKANLRSLENRAPLASDARVYPPSGDATGATDRAAIQTALTAGRPVYLVPGATYYLDQALTLTAVTNGYLGCIGGKARILVTTAWAGSDPEDVDNCMIKLYEVESATAATTVATTAPMGSQSIVVTSATGFAANGWFKITGNSGGADFYRQSVVKPSLGGFNTSLELLRVDSSYASGTTIPHGLPQRLWHGANGADKPVKLLTSVVDGCIIENVEFEAPTTEIVACAIQARFARGVRVIGCTFKGFTANALDYTAVRDGEIKDCTFKGWNNGRISLTSCQKVRVENCHDRLDTGSPRRNTNGSASSRYALRFRYQCYQPEIVNCSFEHAVAGYQAWGGHMPRMVGCTVRDLDFTSLVSTDFVDDEAGNNFFRGVCWDTGADSVDYAEFGFGGDYDLRSDACHTGNAYKHTSQTDAPWNYHGMYFYHDIYDATVRIRHYSVGTSSLNAAAYAMVGILSQDVSGQLDAHLRGVHYAWSSRGSINTVYGTIQHEPQGGQGDSSGEALAIHEGSLSLPQFDCFRWTGGNTAYFLVQGLIDTGAEAYRKPLVRRLIGIPQTGGELYEAENVYLGRFDDSSTPPTYGRAAAIRTGGSANILLLDTHAQTAPTGGTRLVVVLSCYDGFAGVKRFRPVVHLGHGAVAPLYCATALDPREYLESDANGEGTALTLAGGATDWLKCVGRNQHRQAGAGFAQLVR